MNFLPQGAMQRRRARSAPRKRRITPSPSSRSSFPPPPPPPMWNFQQQQQTMNPTATTTTTNPNPFGTTPFQTQSILPRANATPTASSSQLIHLLIGSHPYITTYQTLSKIPLFCGTGGGDVEFSQQQQQQSSTTGVFLQSGNESGVVMRMALEEKFPSVELPASSSTFGMRTETNTSQFRSSSGGGFPFSGPQQQQQRQQSSQKYLFVDRDGSLFHYILAFIRSRGSIYSLPSEYDFTNATRSVSDYGANARSYETFMYRLIEEARYYGLQNMVEKCLDLLHRVAIERRGTLLKGQELQQHTSLVDDPSYELSNMKLLKMAHYAKSDRLLQLCANEDGSMSAFPLPHSELHFRVPLLDESSISTSLGGTHQQMSAMVYFKWHIGDCDGNYYVELDGEVKEQRVASTGFAVNYENTNRQAAQEIMNRLFSYEHSGNVEYATELPPGNHRVRLFVQGFHSNVAYTVSGPVIAQVYLVRKNVVSKIKTLQ